MSPKSSLTSLPTDILKLIALFLPTEDILNLSYTNKFVYKIINEKCFFKQLFDRGIYFPRREVKEKINIPTTSSASSIDADVNWYKNEIRHWNRIKTLVEKIKSIERLKNNSNQIVGIINYSQNLT